MIAAVVIATAFVVAAELNYFAIFIVELQDALACAAHDCIRLWKVVRE